MDSQRREFLSCERPEDVLIYLSESSVSNLDSLADHGEPVSDGLVLVLAGDRGRSVFERAVGVQPMTFAGAAMDTEGTISTDCTSGDCPSKHPDEPDSEHQVRFLLAFAEEQNDEVGGIYGDGDVIHAYAACTCNTTYSDRWVLDE
ncbi:DUF5807 family protein [Halocatena marina]|uniref:DUF5807 family protein n=1 Tax=Halocatena marina TaxID=2934937 RepID=A0ABD5YR01_9EURY|nr:DUF5807 family protein [Halocatena marina]